MTGRAARRRGGCRRRARRRPASRRPRRARRDRTSRAGPATPAAPVSASTATRVDPSSTMRAIAGVDRVAACRIEERSAVAEIVGERDARRARVTLDRRACSSTDTSATGRHGRSVWSPARRTSARRSAAGTRRARRAGRRSKRLTTVSYSAGQRYGRSYESASRTRQPEGAIGSCALSSASALRRRSLPPESARSATRRPGRWSCTPRTRPPMYTRCGPAAAANHEAARPSPHRASG